MWATEPTETKQTGHCRHSFVRGAHLHECDEQEEGIGSPSDLLIEEPGQKSENPILGCTAEEVQERGDFTFCLH